MKKIILLFIFLSACFFFKAQHITTINASICPQTTTILVAPNISGLSNVSYSITPGGQTSSVPAFSVIPTTQNNSFTVFITGQTTQSVTATDMVIYNFIVPPASSLAVQASSPGCNSSTISVSASLTTSYTQTALQWNPVPASLNSTSTMATYFPSSNPFAYASVSYSDPAGCILTVTINILALPTPTFMVNSLSNQITCLNPTVEFYASSNYNFNNSSLSYTWTNGTSTSFSNSLSVSAPGAYTITASDPLTGCSYHDVVSAYVNTIAPTNTISSSQILLTCGSTVVPQVTVTSSPTYNSFQQIFSPLGGTTSINSYSTAYAPHAAGVYSFCSTDKGTGCRSCKQVTVTASGFPTFSLTSPQSFTLGCGNLTAVAVSIINASTDPSGGPLSYTLMQPGFPLPSSSGTLSPTSVFSITTPGTYTALVRDNITSCDSWAMFSVIQNTVAPPNTILNISPVITCSQTQVVLQGLSSSSNVSCSWQSGTISYPGYTLNVLANTASPTASIRGTYTFVVIDNSNLCKSSQSVTVLQNLFAPHASVTATGSMAISCYSPGITLLNVSSTGIPPGSFPLNLPVIGYQWFGPAPQVPLFGSTTYTALVPGTYTMVVVDLNNGCTSSVTAFVSDNRNYPILLNTPDPILLPCPGIASLQAIVAGPMPVMVFSWTAPPTATISSFNSNVITVNTPGAYTIAVTNTLNGCSSKAEVYVYACVGIAETEADQAMEFFPNPNSGVFNLVSKTPQNLSEIEVYNTTGQLVLKQALNEKSISLDLTAQPQGMYLLFIRRSGKIIQNIKVLKQ